MLARWNGSTAAFQRSFLFFYVFQLNTHRVVSRLNQNNQRERETLEELDQVVELAIDVTAVRRRGHRLGEQIGLPSSSPPRRRPLPLLVLIPVTAPLESSAPSESNWLAFLCTYGCISMQDHQKDTVTFLNAVSWSHHQNDSSICTKANINVITSLTTNYI